MTDANLARNGERSGSYQAWADEARKLFTLGWPIILAQLSQNALFLTDVIMMGWLSPTHLAGGSLATAFYNAFLLFGIGTVTAVAPLVAQARGSGDIKAIRRIVRQGLWATLIISAILIPVVLQVRPIFGLLGQEPQIIDLADSFLSVVAFVFLPGLGIIVLRSFLAAHGSTCIVLLISVAGIALNALSNMALMFGNWGFPRLELRGAAISTLAVNAFMFLAMLTYVLTHRRFKRYHILARFWKSDWSHLRQIFTIGTPIGLTLLAEVGLFTAAAFLMGRLGDNELAAHAIALQISSLTFMVPLGLGQATTVRVGLAYGARSAEGVRKAGWTAFALGIGFMCISCTAFVLFPHQLVGLFLDASKPLNAEAIALAATYLGVAALFQLVDGAQAIGASSLRGLSDTRIPAMMAILGYWAVGFPIAYVLGFVVGLRGVGVWLGLAAGLAVVAVVLTTRFALRERLGLIKTLTGGTAPA